MNKEKTYIKKESSRTNYRNFPMVPRVVFGAGSFDQLGDILLPHRKNSDAPIIYIVDDVFEASTLTARIPRIFNDLIVYINAEEEPKTQQVDSLVERIKKDFTEPPSGIVGIGGGTILDLAKAVAVMYTNKGSSSNYQGWDLVEKPSLYHVGIPTISGTGAEVSRTTVLTGPKMKLGINSDYTTFDQVLMDPELTRGVPKDQWFYTGMDCFIHCVESLNGTYLNTFSQSYGEKAMELCLEVFLGDPEPHESREKLMMASWHGGMSIAYSQVGIAHAMSYGLSFLLGIRHGLGNCLVFNHLKDYYPEGVELFQQMLHKQDIELPKGICSGLTEEDLETMCEVSMRMEPLWENALGVNWRDQINRDVLKEIYARI